DAMANWIVKVELSDLSQLESLMDEEAYHAHCEAEKH
ncbi:MAG: glycine cleavage system protein H, partial [Duncaniella sp.]|nr:glycine cleavage system protein H [Duncaniella sp.]